MFDARFNDSLMASLYSFFSQSFSSLNRIASTALQQKTRGLLKWKSCFERCSENCRWRCLLLSYFRGTRRGILYDQSHDFGWVNSNDCLNPSVVSFAVFPLPLLSFCFSLFLLLFSPAVSLDLFNPSFFPDKHSGQEWHSNDSLCFSILFSLVSWIHSSWCPLVTVSLEKLAAPLIVPFEFPKNIQLGMRVRLLCSIMQGDPPFIFSWMKDGKPLDPSPLSLGVRSDDFSMDLTFSRVTPRHNGNYTCLASNDAATVSHSAILVVDGMDEITSFSCL